MGIGPYGSITRGAAKRAVGDAGPYGRLQIVRWGGPMWASAPTKALQEGAVRGKNPPVTALSCQPPLGKGAEGTGDADCHDQFANWSRNDMVYYGRKPPGWGVAYARGRRKCMYQILLVEDDRALALAVQKLLESYGSRVRCVEDFADVLGEFAACQPQLVLMDIKLPYRDGYYWCSRIREISAVPVVFLSSASDNMNIVMALNMGGDDFIAKPVDPMVLTAKVQAVLRRTYEITGAGQTVEFCGATLSLGDGCLHTEKGRVELTKNEFRILQLLLENRGKIVSREELMMHLWQSDLYVEENTLTVNVARLRKKLEEGGLEGVILTKPGRGYIIL